MRFADLGLDASKEYLVYEFWSDRMTGTFKDVFPYGTLEPYGLKSYAIREKLNRPQILSTNRHLSQGGADLLDVQWDERTLTLSGKSEVVAEDAYTLVLHLPDGYRVESADFDGRPAKVAPEGNLARVGLRPAESKDVGWSVKFGRDR